MAFIQRIKEFAESLTLDCELSEDAKTLVVRIPCDWRSEEFKFLPSVTIQRMDNYAIDIVSVVNSFYTRPLEIDVAEDNIFDIVSARIANMQKLCQTDGGAYRRLEKAFDTLLELERERIAQNQAQRVLPEWLVYDDEEPADEEPAEQADEEQSDEEPAEQAEEEPAEEEPAEEEPAEEEPAADDEKAEKGSP